MRTDLSDGDKDKESGFYILKHTIMPAVLTENLFMDNKKEYEFLLSPEGKEAIVNLHVQGILDYISKIKQTTLSIKQIHNQEITWGKSYLNVLKIS